MKTTSTIITNAEAFLLTHVAGVLAYAQRDAVFAESLAAYVQQRGWRQSVLGHTDASAHLTPTTQHDAIASTHWILGTLDSHREYKSARGILATFASNYESPKDFVLGVVGLAVVGPTLGLISSKKKKRNQMQLVVDTAWHAQSTEEERLALTLRLSQQIVAKELQHAGGNIYNLHPDTADWVMSDPASKIYTGDRPTLAKLQTAAQAERLSHICATDESGSVYAIAISPAVNDSFVQDSLS